MRTTVIYSTLFYLLLHLNALAQPNNYSIDNCFPEKQIALKHGKELMPVYFNYSQRKLFYNGNIRVNGNEFLNTCRAINDEQVQLQIERYDKLTRNKRKLLGAMIACGVGGYITMMASSFIYTGNGYDNTGRYTAIGVGALAFFVATPVLAISTAVPHQKRKEIVFRDLPAAYNLYAETQNQK